VLAAFIGQTLVIGRPVVEDKVPPVLGEAERHTSSD
jgi:hypothetical protein